MGRYKRLTTSEKRRRQRLAMFRTQKGLCHWCAQPMQLSKDGSVPVGEHRRDSWATIDHLHPRGHPERGKHENEWTHVLACGKCNHDRNEQFTASLPKETLWALSGRAPQTSSDS